MANELDFGTGIALIKGLGGKPTDEQVTTAVDAWLDAHPEATTTVEDGSISEAKLDNNLKGVVADVGDLKTAIDDLSTATSLDVGKALSPKTVANGKVTEWQFKVIGGGGGGGAVEDVQVNGVSVVDGEGVANVPVASGSVFGVVKVASSNGVFAESGTLYLSKATSDQIKASAQNYRAIVPSNQHESTFYGLAKAAGDSTQSASNKAVGTYTEDAKSKISDMLNGSVAVSGTTPSITAKSGIRYVCGEVSTLAVTLPASGIVDVVFTSGSTPTVLTVTPPTGVTAVKWAGGFDPTSLDANTTYEINVMDGEFGVVGAWT